MDLVRIGFCVEYGTLDKYTAFFHDQEHAMRYAINTRGIIHEMYICKSVGARCGCDAAPQHAPPAGETGPV